MISKRLPAILAILIVFSALIRGAHDLWAATLVHIAILFVFVILLFSASIQSEGLRLFAAPVLAVLAVTWFFSFRKSINPSESFLAVTDALFCLLAFIIASNTMEEEGSENILLKLMVPCLWAQAILIFLRNNPLINANVAAAFVLLWVPPLKAQWMSAVGRKGRIYWASGLAACAVILIASQSVWAWVLLLVAAIVAFSKKLKPVFWILGSVVIGALVWVKVQPGSASLDRLEWWSSGFRMFGARPMLGLGIGNYASAFSSFKSGDVQSTLFAHSWLVTLLAETGVLGALAVLAFFVWWFIAARRVGEAIPAVRPYKAGLYLFIAYTLVSLGSEYLVNKLTVAVFMGLIIAKGGMGWKLPLRKSGAIITAAVAVALLPSLISPFLASRHLVDGQVYLVQGNLEEADKHFSLALSLDPRVWEAHNGRAQVAFENFEKTGEKRFLERAMVYQGRAANLNKLNMALRKELRYYSDLEKKGGAAN